LELRHAVYEVHLPVIKQRLDDAEERLGDGSGEAEGRACRARHDPNIFIKAFFCQ